MKIIDLSKSLRTNMEVYAGDPAVEIDIVHTHKIHGWELRKMTFGSHTGTHVDAFSHMDEQGMTLDQIPLDKFFGCSLVVDIDQEFPKNRGLFFRVKVEMNMVDKIINAHPPFVGGDIDEVAQRALLQAGVITYTDLVNLDQIPTNTEFMFYGFPLPIEAGDGSPVRAVAVLEEPEESTL